MKEREVTKVDDSNDPTPSPNATARRGAGISEPTLSEDHMFEALAHERRRYLLYTLLEDEAWSLERIATKVAAWQDGVPEEDVDREEVEHVYASLYHAHVPKLVDLGIVEFDRDTETIATGPHAEQVLEVLELTGGGDAARLEAHARSDEDDRFD